ncbi:class I SAM-dependent methyltransferase [Actinomadura sp. DC4]|uniref:class I SAM-dependent methyltransferase n=1 Tax=Actinomadura sp. DC4 TaxID=3055069 RepID=UPI0025B04A39|nr:class I SAM-dependent methyltransferase [Actinomadura sp. DC4]MDN3357682.1 class I SAM-dependent methyltransferase [Actinomadura sp. DC4]
MIDRAADAERYEVVCGGFDAPLFAAAAIGERDRVLDIGCGYGGTTRSAARRAHQGHAVGNDLAAPVLEQARSLAADEAIGNVTFETGDAQTYPFEAGGFDVVISRFGMMFFADPVAAFANVGTALRPGGRLVFATVGPPEGNDLPRLLATAMGGEPAAAVHSLADPAHVEDVVTGAGFRDLALAPAETTIALGADAAEAAAFILAWGALSPGDLGAALTEAARPYETSEGVHLRSTAWLVSAVRP